MLSCNSEFYSLPVKDGFVTQDKKGKDSPCFILFQCFVELSASFTLLSMYKMYLVDYAKFGSSEVSRITQVIEKSNKGMQ